jgi:uncharacterized protein YybS (DUF2232 family)
MARLKSVLDLTRSAALSAVLFLLGGMVPVAGAALMLCAPTPVLTDGLRHQRPYWRIAIVLALAAAVVVVAAGPLQALGFALTLGLATVLMAILLRRQWSCEWIVFACTAAMWTAAGVGLLVWAGSPLALARQLHDFVAAAMSHSAALYEKLGMSQAQSRELSDQVLEVTTRLSPALAAMVGALAILVNLGLVARWLGKERIGYELFTGLVTWRTPEWLVWLLLATGFGMFIPLPPAQLAATNGFVLIAAIYFCQGLAIMAYYLQMLAMPRMVRGTIYVIAMLQPVLAALVCLAGIFDLWIDFRRLKPPSQEAGSLDDFF